MGGVVSVFGSGDDPKIIKLLSVCIFRRITVNLPSLKGY
jgi:hypothetical protein